MKEAPPLRMWMVSPKIMCNKHLLGEHGEIHKHRHNFVKKHSITGRVSPEVQIEPMAMGSRHEELVREMIARGMKHQSPYEMPDLSYLPKGEKTARVDRQESLRVLLGRCGECRQRYNKEERDGEIDSRVSKKGIRGIN